MERNYTLGEFSTQITIDHATYPINIHIVPDTLTSHSLILGTDFLDTIELVMKGGEISIAKLNVLEVFNISVETATDRTDLSHIVIPEHKNAVENLVESYKPNKIREVGVKMNVILTDDVPVYQRRLSPEEKDEVNKQIASWLKNGIIQQSQNYASPIVLVKKKNRSTRICVDYRQLDKKIVKDRSVTTNRGRIKRVTRGKDI